MHKKWLFFLPLVGILTVSILLLVGLKQDPSKIASALINKPVPEFYQPDLVNSSKIISLKDFPKRPFLLNVWGSWCIYCQQEHPLLMEISQHIAILGLNYRDNVNHALKMLQQMGNPYQLNINDSRGELAIKLGVDGAPETYLIDSNGIIRYRHSGLLDRQTWQDIFIPQIQQLTQNQ